MATLAEFLCEKAAAFTRGDMAACAAMFDTPTKLTFGTQVLHAPDAQSIVTAFDTYRDNLLVESYSHTEAVVDYASELHDGQANALVTWTNYSTRDAKIVVMEANYICRLDAAGQWRIVNVEYLDAGKSRLMQGVPLA